MPPETTARPPRIRWCPACHTRAERFGPGPNGRPDATCRSCRALERHRFLALLLEGLAPVVATARLVVDIAPSPQITRILQRMAPAQYVRVDFDPAADARAVDVQASLTALPFPDGSIDLLVCYHVLEHVPDDAKAMAEIGRALHDGGLAIVQVPWRPDRLTDEDASAPAEERIRRFGQADHVRMYGKDFDDRLYKVGLTSYRLTPADVVGDHLVQVFRLEPHETVWLVRRDGGRTAALDADTVRLRTLQLIAESHTATDRSVAVADARAASWERAYRRLRSQPVVRIAAAVAAPVRRIRRR